MKIRLVWNEAGSVWKYSVKKRKFGLFWISFFDTDNYDSAAVVFNEACKSHIMAEKEA